MRIFLFAYFGIIFLLIAAGIADLYLLATNQQTISAWLRLHPNYYVIGAATMMLFIIWLGLHLWYKI